MSSTPENLILVATGGVDGWVSVNDVTGVVLNSAAFVYDHDSGPQAVVIQDIDVPGNRLLLWSNGGPINASDLTVPAGATVSLTVNNYNVPGAPVNTQNIVIPYTLNNTTNTVPFTVNGILGQTANLMSWRVNGVEKTFIDANGNFSGTLANAAVIDDTTTNATHYLNFTSAATGSLPIKASSTKLTWNPLSGNLSVTGSAVINNSAVGTIPLTVNAISGQTAKLQSWGVNGTEKASIDKGGLGYFANGVTTPQGISALNLTLPDTSSIYLGTTWGTRTLTFWGGSTVFATLGTVDGLVMNAGNLWLQKGAVGIIGTKDNFALALAVNGSEKMRIDTSGNVGIGTAPATKFHVADGTGYLKFSNVSQQNLIVVGVNASLILDSVGGSYPGVFINKAGVAAANIAPDDANTLIFHAYPATSATAVGHILNSYFNLTTAGAKLLSVRNAGVEKAYIDKDGQAVFQGALYATNFIASNLVDTSNIYPGTGNTGLQLRGNINDASNATAIRIGNLNALSTAGAKIVSFQNAGAEKASIDKDGNGTFGGVGGWAAADAFYARGTQGAFLIGQAGDGASAVGIILNNNATLSTAGAKLLSVRNAGVEKSYIDKDGAIYGAGSINAGTNLGFAGGYFVGTNTVFNKITSYTNDGVGAVGWVINTNNTLTGASSKLVSFQNYATEKSFINKDGIASFGSVTPITIGDAVVKSNGSYLSLVGGGDDGASAVAIFMDSAVTYSTPGARLLSIRNSGAERVYIDKDGGIHCLRSSTDTLSNSSLHLKSAIPIIVMEGVGGSSRTFAITNNFQAANLMQFLYSTSSGTAASATALCYDDSGRIGIGTTTLALRLQVVAPDDTGTGIAKFVTANLTTGTEVAYWGIRAMGTNTSNDISVLAKNTGYVYLGSDTNGTGIRFRQTDPNSIWNGLSTLGLSAGVADGASAVGVVINNTTTLSTAGAKLLSVRNNGTEKFYVTKDGFAVAVAFDAPAATAYLRGAMADGTSAVGVVVDSTVALTASGAKLLSIRNNGTEKAFVDKDGTGYFSGNLAVGTASLLYRLNVNGLSNTVGVGVIATEADGNWFYAGGTVAGNANLFTSNIVATGTVQLNVRNGGSGGAGISVVVQGATAGDPSVGWTVSGVIDFVAGLDNSDSDKFKMGYSSTPSAITAVNTALTIENAEKTTIRGAPADGSAAVSVVIDSPTLTIAGAKLLSIRNNGAEKVYFDKDGNLVAFGNVTAVGSLSADLVGSRTAASLGLLSAVPDGATATALLVNTTTTLTGSSAKLLGVYNNGVEKAFIDKDGRFGIGNMTLAPGNGGNLVSFLNAGTLKAYIDSGGNVAGNSFWSMPSAGLSLGGQVADGASAVGAIIDNNTTLSTSGAKLLSVRNNGVEKAFIDKDGNLATPEIRLGGATFSRIGIDGSNSPFFGYNIKYATGFKHDSTGTIAGIATNISGGVDFYLGSSQVAGTAATVKAAIDKDGYITSAGSPVGRKVAVPATAGAAGVVGDWATSSTFLYICTALNTWQRTAITLATW
jgi:hypothetical protein